MKKIQAPGDLLGDGRFLETQFTGEPQQLDLVTQARHDLRTFAFGPARVFQVDQQQVDGAQLLQHGDAAGLGRVSGDDRPDAQAAEGADDGLGWDAGRCRLRKCGFEAAFDHACRGGAFVLAALAHGGVLLCDGLQLEPDTLGTEGAAEPFGRALRELHLVAKNEADFRVVMLHDVEQHVVQQSGECGAITGLLCIARHQCVHHAAWRLLSSSPATVDPSSPALGATVRP